MTPLEFKNQWKLGGDILNKISPNRISEFKLSKSVFDFLTLAGLPDDAAPFLIFSKDSDDPFYGVHRLTKMYEFLEVEFDKYIRIGSCNDGDPIVINTSKNDQIEYLDHEDNFASSFFNSSFNAMAKSLIAYRNFVNTILVENGDEALLNSNFTDSQFSSLKLAIQRADDQTYLKDGFWKTQIEMDLEMRNED